VETMLDKAHRFFAHKRIAFIGVSRDEKDFSRGMLRDLSQRGYDVVPVHPAVEAMDGRRCFARVQDIVPPVEAALVMTPPARTADAVKDCVRAGVRDVWLHRGTGPGSASPEALEACHASGIEPVTDLCPYMALPNAGLVHRIHRFFSRSARAPVSRP
jgi:uncharacterized protein